MLIHRKGNRYNMNSFQFCFLASDSKRVLDEESCSLKLLLLIEIWERQFVLEKDTILVVFLIEVLTFVSFQEKMLA